MFFGKRRFFLTFSDFRHLFLRQICVFAIFESSSTISAFNDIVSVEASDEIFINDLSFRFEHFNKIFTEEQDFFFEIFMAKFSISFPEVLTRAFVIVVKFLGLVAPDVEMTV